MFDITDAGAIFVYALKNLTEKELSEFSKDNPIKIKVANIEGVIFIFAKVSEQPWNDIPFSVHLAKNLVEFAPAGAKKWNHFFGSPCSRKKYFSGCECEFCPPSAGKLCANRLKLFCPKSFAFRTDSNSLSTKKDRLF